MVRMQAHEIELVKRVQAHDESAFDELYHAYYQRAFALAYRLTKDDADAQDIVQESFLQVHRSIHNLQNPKHFYAWLHRIIHSKCVNMFYDNRNEHAMDPEKLAKVKEYEEKRRYMLPQEESSFGSERDVLIHLMAQMDDKYREVLELAYFEQMKLKEIAGYLDLPLGTVKTRARRAKEELKLKITQFEAQEQRHISFNVDVLFPTLSLFSLSQLGSLVKQRSTDFLIGQGVNAVCAVSFALLAVSGGAMVWMDQESAQNMEAPRQEAGFYQDDFSEEVRLPNHAFGSYMYEDIAVTSSQRAYYVCINWALDYAQMSGKSKYEIVAIHEIYQALKQTNDRYYQMIQERGWERDFLKLYDSIKHE